MIFLIVPSRDIGGAEKRLIGVFTELSLNSPFPIKLAASKKLFEKLASISDLHKVDPKSVVFFEFNLSSNSSYAKSTELFIKTHAKKNDTLHFVWKFPFLCNLRAYRTIFSFTESSLRNVNYKGKIEYYFSFLKSNAIDILDPTVFRKIATQFKLTGKNVTLTPGSYVDGEISNSLNFESKDNTIVHLGRFVEGKNIERFLTAIPTIHKKLLEDGIVDAKFQIIGYGTLESRFRSIVTGAQYEGINIEIFFDANPIVFLKKSKVIISIQKENNYPSKALLEGIITGNIPCVTNVGTTDLIAPPSFSTSLSRTFTDTELARACSEILKLSPNALNERSQIGINFIKENFSIDKTINYYSKIYDRP